MKRQSLWWGVTAWVAVVVIASALTWTVIDSAGKEVLGSGSAASGLSTASQDPDGLETNSPSGQPSKKPTGKPTKKPSSTPTSAASPSSAPTTAVPSPSPTQARSESSAPTPNSNPSPKPPRPPKPEAQVRSWQGSAGIVVVRCEGTRISLQSTSPNDGWRIEVSDRGPGRVEVEFESQGESERKTKVRAECRGGVPRFEVNTEGGSDDSDDSEASED